MNTKRQTVWLVSMLSLMVVLSAYYLFTEDASKLNVSTNGQQGSDQIKVQTSELGHPDTHQDGAGKDPAKSGQADKPSTSQGKGTDKAAAAGAQTKNDKTSGTDDEILQAYESQGKSGADKMAALKLKYDEMLKLKQNQLQSVMVDQKASADAIAKAHDDMNIMMAEDASRQNIEDVLGQQFAGVIVTEEEGKWKVVVQNDKLERSEKVSIIDLVMTEMKVGPDRVMIQHVPNT